MTYRYGHIFSLSLGLLLMCLSQIQHPHHHHSTSSSSSLLFRDGSEKKLLELLQNVERELKIYIYPIPDGVRRCIRDNEGKGYKWRNNLLNI